MKAIRAKQVTDRTGRRRWCVWIGTGAGPDGTCQQFDSETDCLRYVYELKRWHSEYECFVEYDSRVPEVYFS